MRKMILVISMLTWVLSGCTQKESVEQVDLEAIMGSIEESIYREVKESVEAMHETDTMKETTEEAEPALEETTEESVNTADPWENGMLEAIGLADMPKPNDTYIAVCETYSEEKHNPINGELYTSSSWTIQFSDELYENYVTELINYMAQKCPFMVDTITVQEENGLRSGIGIVESTVEPMSIGKYLHIHNNQVYFISFEDHLYCIDIRTGEIPFFSSSGIEGIDELYGDDLNNAIISYLKNMEQ